MNEAFDVFFHQRAIPEDFGTTIFEQDSVDELALECESAYSRVTGNSLSLTASEELLKQLQHSQSYRGYLEIQFFHAQLDEEALLYEFKELFPQFIWIKVAEEIEAEFSIYACEFIPAVFKKEGTGEAISFNLKESLQQMKGTVNQPLSALVEAHLKELLQDEGEETAIDDAPLETSNELSFAVDMSVTPEAEPMPAKKPKKKAKSVEPATLLPQETVATPDMVEPVSDSEVIFLRESLKRETAAKERLQIAKEKLEHELLSIESNLLTSGLKRFKKKRKIKVDEEDWYKPVKIDLIHYDDLYKKAKFIEQSWKLNKELVTTTEKMIVTKDELTYERERVERIKNGVSEIDLQSMMEQCHLINNRVKINRGFLFIKPYAKLYQIDYEQLERISAFFDIIQTENRLLEEIILKADSESTTE